MSMNEQQPGQPQGRQPLEQQQTYEQAHQPQSQSGYNDQQVKVLQSQPQVSQPQSQYSAQQTMSMPPVPMAPAPQYPFQHPQYSQQPQYVASQVQPQPQYQPVPQPQPYAASSRIEVPQQAAQAQPLPYAMPPYSTTQPAALPQPHHYAAAQPQYPMAQNQFQPQPTPARPATPQYAAPYPLTYPRLQPQPQSQPYVYAPPQPPVMAINPRQLWKTWRRRVVNRAMGLAFIYEAMMYVGSIVAVIALGVIMPSWSDSTRGDGIISLTSLVFAMGFLLIMRNRDILTREFWLGGLHRDTYGEPNQLGRISQYGGGRMRAQWFLIFILLGLGVQSVVTLAQMGVSMFGGDLVSPTSESLDESSNTVTMWLYVGLFGPICEEVMFRGVLMKELKPLGKNFAIVTSALAFGLFHDDFVQGTFAFLFGLILGFIAMEYSLVWAIALHIFNNAILSGVIDTWFAGQLNDSQYAVYTIVLTAIGVVGAVMALALYGRGLKQYRMRNRSIPDTYVGWSSPVFIAFVIVNLGMAALLLTEALAS
ncbi:CPBP family intramembrane glutamic endopeptidase [Bifidobacterium felsineum]|uniref:CPBP family intramembrane glutamic endopeptidase n=1 Tax=Bifidobacterium felsineum TaxID=2045440 RepID=UPI001F0B3244|nr:CPBP family intramembrane glutamic endopeptidase [Bifidobacterium felsineum]